MDASDWSPNLVYFLWLFVCNASGLAILYVWRFEGSKLADSHPESNPLLPDRSPEEQPSARCRGWSWLLGEIRPSGVDRSTSRVLLPTAVHGRTIPHSAHGQSTYGSSIELSPVHSL